MSKATHYRRFDWLVVEAKDVHAGDLYANGATVTSATVGPATVEGEHETMQPTKGKVLIRCGEGFATRLDAESGVVVGRNFKPPR